MALRVIRAVSTAIMLLVFGTLAYGADKHLLLGTWMVDVSRLKIPDPPRSVIFKLAEAGAGAFHLTVDIVHSDGSKAHGETTFQPDGTAAQGEGSTDVDVVSMTMPNQRTLVMGAGFKGNPSSTRVWSLADDGKHMTETIIRHAADGTPYTITNTWVLALRRGEM